jgi:hypothetical protein
MNLSINGGEGISFLLNIAIKTLTLSAAFAASIWLNGHFLKTTYGKYADYYTNCFTLYSILLILTERFSSSSNNENIISETDGVYAFPAGSLLDGTNVVTILQDNMGLDETDAHPDTSKSPRGIRGFQLNGGSSEFGEWKVQGKIGGYRG